MRAVRSGILAAIRNQQTSENGRGPFYVEDTCIDCGLCPDTAPQFFKRFDEGGYSIVYRQPQTTEERALAEEAVSGCPTESIGNDGAA
jgi:ferredoxin